jgi:integrase
VPRVGTKEGDCLQREQLAVWFAAVGKIQNPVISTYLQALLLTGARREEMAALRWDDVDFQWRSLSIADKVEQDAGRMIPLTPYLASLLLELKRRNDTPPNVRLLARMEARGEKWKPSPWVFASQTAADGKIAEPRIAHTKALDMAGLPHVSLHGLRRSFGTLSEWCEVPVGIVAQIQGHKPSAIAEKHYRRRPLDLLRMWHDKIEAWMLEQAGIDFKPEQAKPGLRAVNT